MKAVYRFVTGEIKEIEVSEDVYEVLVELDRQEYNNDHKETRRHISLNMMAEVQGVQFASGDIDALDLLLHTIKRQALRKAIVSLLPQQQILLEQVFIQRRSFAEISREEGVSESAIRDRLRRIYIKIEKILK